MVTRVAASRWLLPILLAAIFAPVLIGQKRLAFRDVSFFYTPLYAHTASLSGWEDPLPYWNPSDGWTDGAAGMPLAGETTTAVFYPIRWLVYAVIRDAAIAISWYTYLHLSMAAMAMFWLSEKLQPHRTDESLAYRNRRQARSNLAALVYTFSGPVFSLYCNTVFLVSAAWLPLAIAMPAMWFRHRRVDRPIVVISGVATGAMTLGGDPQTSFHVATLWAVAAVGITATRRFAVKEIVASFAIAAAVAAIVAAPQLAETISWASQSSRASLMTSEQRMRFSVPVWSWAECLTPWAWGRLVPVNARLSRLIVGDSPLWASTLFMGTFGLMSVVAAISRRSLRRRCLPWLLIGGIAAALSMGDHFIVPLYQTLCRIVPFYDAFRYPPKWLPLVSISIACIVATVSTRQVLRRLRHWPLILLGLLVVHAAYCHWLASHLANVPDELWGPLDRSLALEMITISIASTMAVAVGLGWLCRRKNSSRCNIGAVVLLTAIEMGWVGHTMLHRVDRQTTAAIDVRSGERFIRISRPDRFIRISRPDQWPQRWLETSDSDRLEDVEQAQRRIGFGRWHLSHDVSMINSMFSIESSALRDEFQRLRELDQNLTVADRLESFALHHQCDGLWWEIDPANRSANQPIAPKILRYPKAALKQEFDSSSPPQFYPRRPKWITALILSWLICGLWTLGRMVVSVIGRGLEWRR